MPALSRLRVVLLEEWPLQPRPLASSLTLSEPPWTLLCRPSRSKVRSGVISLPEPSSREGWGAVYRIVRVAWIVSTTQQRDLGRCITLEPVRQGRSNESERAHRRHRRPPLLQQESCLSSPL